MKATILIVIALLLPFRLLGQPSLPLVPQKIILVDGRVFEEATVTKSNASEASITTSTGITRVSFELLPKELVVALGFDPELAKAHVSESNIQSQLSAKQIAEAAAKEAKFENWKSALREEQNNLQLWISDQLQKNAPLSAFRDERQQREAAFEASKAKYVALRKLLATLRLEESLEGQCSEAVLRSKVFIGMPYELALLSWGAPSEVNTTHSEVGEFQQWVYRSGYSASYLYIRGGVVTTIQN